MCGRITATFEFSDIRLRWNLDRDLPKYTPRFNIAPETSPNVPIIVRHKGANECRLGQAAEYELETGTAKWMNKSTSSMENIGDSEVVFVTVRLLH